MLVPCVSKATCQVVVGLLDRLVMLSTAQYPLPQSLFVGSVSVRPPPEQPGQLPPQSTSVSLPLCTPSLQLGAWQMPFVHTLLWQSMAPKQPAPSGHAWQPPPQSTSVS